MPQKLDDCVKKLIEDGYDKSAAWAICKASINNDAALKYTIDEDSGFLKVGGICARNGVQDYMGYEIGLTGEDANKVFAVYRPEDEVAASLSSYNGAIITNNHPDEMIVSTETPHLNKGNVSEAKGYKQDGMYYIYAQATITDPELIELIKNGKRELSAGYTRDLVKESGTAPCGKPYNYVQKNIKVNHVAVVDEGRCGNLCKLNLDSKGKTMAIRVQLDGQTVTLDEAETVKYIAKLKTQIDEAMGEAEKAKSEKDEAMTAQEELAAKIETLTKELEDAKAAMEKMLSPEEVEAMAEESAEISKDAEELEIETKETSNDGKMKEIIGAVTDNKHSLDSIEGSALKTLYRVSVDQAKVAKKAQADGYRGVENDKKPFVKTGNLSNDLNTIAANARKERGAK